MFEYSICPFVSRSVGSFTFFFYLLETNSLNFSMLHKILWVYKNLAEEGEGGCQDDEDLHSFLCLPSAHCQHILTYFSF